ncbi:DUF2635 domain-containing protein [Lonepinella sp. BR2271]|uniref:DUF2635 domain-containing protein n=1 Tax=Lonepinella sp. BR2271 TaxID=3434550 RepID=UPI003F6DBD54
MLVKAKDGVKVPFENNPAQVIEQEAVSVADSLYYRRLVQQGDLVIVENVAKTKTSGKVKTEKGAD